MKYRYGSKKNKSLAQGMMEFALVIPVLFTILIGMMEIGRLMLIFISVTTASRTAARYGSAVGDDGAGPQYKDCDAISNAGLIMSPISGIATSDITIEFDHGDTNPLVSPYATCATLPGDVAFGDRILVSVTTNFQPLDIVPFFKLQSFPMKSTSRRLIQITNPDAFYTATYDPFPVYPTYTEGPPPTPTFTPPANPTNTPIIPDTATPTWTPGTPTNTPTTGPPTSTPIGPPEEPYYDQFDPNAITTTSSGQNCQNTIVNWEYAPSGNDPLGDPYPDNWSINPGSSPVIYYVTKGDASPWVVADPIRSANVGSINHNKSINVKVQAVFAGPMVSYKLVLNITCKFGALQSIGFWQELP